MTRHAGGEWIRGFLTMLLALAPMGCIDYFAEPPSLGPLPDATSDVCVSAVEVCDGVDNDCDGATDEGASETLCLPPMSNADHGGVACLDGMCVLECYAGRHDADRRFESGCEYDCMPFDPPASESAEECNGRDDDCDGRVDEVVDLDPPPALEQRGVCATTVKVCTGADWREPRPEEIADYEVDETRCDGQDNDCDGRVDEGVVGCDPGCDGLDDDQDNRSDEGCVEVRCGAEGMDEVSTPPCNGRVDGIVIPAGWVYIPPGTFMMGSPDGDGDRRPNEQPAHSVEILQPFLMQTTETTLGEWRAVVGSNPSEIRPCGPNGMTDPDTCPIVTINWFEMAEYTNRRSLMDGFTACYVMTNCVGVPGEGMTCDLHVDIVPGCDGYRFPTEAQWEYAARAGAMSRYWFVEGEVDLRDVAWYEGNQCNACEEINDCLACMICNNCPACVVCRSVRAVGQLRANPWGLFDVHGNVSESVWDWDGDYSDAPVTDPMGPPSGAHRVVRNGRFFDTARGQRAAVRGAREPSNNDEWDGFRPVRMLYDQ